ARSACPAQRRLRRRGSLRPPHSVSLPKGREDAGSGLGENSGVPSPLGEKDRMKGLKLLAVSSGGLPPGQALRRFTRWHAEYFCFHILLEARDAEFASESALLVAAERNVQAHPDAAIDARCPAAQLVGECDRLLVRGGSDARRKP